MSNSDVIVRAVVFYHEAIKAKLKTLGSETVQLQAELELLEEILATGAKDVEHIQQESEKTKADVSGH